jgi:hypothetical protein
MEENNITEGTLIPGEDYVFGIKNGQRFINGVPAQEFINTLPRKELLRIVILGLTKTSDYR